MMNEGMNMRKLVAVGLVLVAGAVVAAPVRMTIPKMTLAPTIDGVLEKGEWARAGQYNRFCRLKSSEAFNHGGFVFVGRDDANLYFAIATESNPLTGVLRTLQSNGRSQRDAFWDDSLDFDFISDMRVDSPSISHYCANFHGAFFATARRDGKQVNWLPEGFVCKSTEKDGWWFFELKVPFASIDFAPVSERVFGLRVARNWHNVQRSSKEDTFFGIQTSLAENDVAFESAGGATELVFDDAAPVVQVSQLGGAAGDEEAVSYPVVINVNNISDRARTFDVVISGKPERSKPGLINARVTLAPGEKKDVRLDGAVLGDEKIDLETKVTEGGVMLFNRHLVFQRNYASVPWAGTKGAVAQAKLKFGHFPSHRLIHAKADVSTLEDRPQPTVIAWTLRRAAGETLATTNTVATAEGFSEIYWTIPDLGPITEKCGSPDYVIAYEAQGCEKGKAEQVFKREVFPWENNDIGLSDTIPPPFEKVRVSNCAEVEKVSVVLRDHYVDKKSGLWRQVVAKGHELLARPMRLVKGGEGIRKKEVQLATFSSSWDYDGYMEWTLTLKPGHHEPMYLEVPVKASEAKLMHAVTDSVGYNFAGKVPAGQGRVWDSTKAPGGKDFVNDFIPYVWIGGCLRGISVTADNDRGWVEGDGIRKESQPCYEIIREDDGTVVLRLNLIQRAVDIKEPRTIKLGFMATPVKPMVEHWRSHPVGALFGSNICWGGLIEALEPYDEADTFWLKMAEARRTGVWDKAYYDKVMAEFPYDGEPGTELRQFCEKRYRDHYHFALQSAANIRHRDPAVFYTNPRGVELGGRAGMTFCDEWNRKVLAYDKHVFGRHAKRDYDVDPCKSYRDYAVWCYRRMVTTRACDYLYWDCTFPSCNLNLGIGTAAYTRSDGTVQGDAGVSNMRALIRRCAVMQAENGYESRFNWAHMTNTAIAPMLAFAGINFDWEDAADTTTFQDRYGIDHILACSTGRQFGNIVNMLAFYKGNTPEEHARLDRCGAGVMLAFEFRWRWNCATWRTRHEMLEKWGYRKNDTRVWNFWDEDEAFPVRVNGQTFDSEDPGRNRCAVLAMSREGKAIVVVSDFSEGGEYRICPDVLKMGIATGAKAYDFETGEPVAFAAGEATVSIAKHDFRIVEFR